MNVIYYYYISYYYYYILAYAIIIIIIISDIGIGNDSAGSCICYWVTLIIK